MVTLPELARSNAAKMAALVALWGAKVRMERVTRGIAACGNRQRESDPSF
jgi:hypothetical protein